MRRLVTGLLILVSALTLVLASISLWTRQNVIDTDRFVSNVETMVDLPEVESRINERVTETVMAQPQLQDAVDSAITALPERLQQFRGPMEDGVQSLVSAGVQRLLTNDPFRPLTTAAISSAHDRLVAGEPLQLTLGQAKERVPAAVQDGLAGQVLDLLPDDVGVTLLSPDDSPQIYTAIDLLESVWWWLGLLALATLAGALGISRRRRRTLRAWAVTTTVLLVAVLAALRVTRGLLLPQARPENREAVGAVYDVLAGSLRSWTLWLLAAVLLVLVLTLTWGRLGLVAGVRNGIASARAQLADRRAQSTSTPALAVEGGTADGAVPPPTTAADASWPSRVAAWTRAFTNGLELRRRSARLGGYVRAHHGPARWTAVALAAVLLLLWPDPTLSVLVWVGALVALYLGALAWLEDQAGDEVAEATADEPGAPAAGAPVAVPAGMVPAPRSAQPSPDGDGNGVPAVAPVEPGTPAASPLVPTALTPEALTKLNDRLDLLVRLGAARDAGVLTDEEFGREKSRLLVV